MKAWGLSLTTLLVAVFVSAMLTGETAGNPPHLDRFDKVDTNHDGRVTGDEFIAASIKQFGKIDRDSDGEITNDDARAGVAQAGGHPAGQRQVLAALDSDGDGAISLAEFKGDSALAFRRFDRDKDGGLTPAEFDSAQQVMPERNLPLPN